MSLQLLHLIDSFITANHFFNHQILIKAVYSYSHIILELAPINFRNEYLIHALVIIFHDLLIFRI